MTLHEQMVEDLKTIHEDMGQPTFVWLHDGNTYPCIASITDIKNDLIEGGFNVEQMVTMTVPRYDSDGNLTFLNDVIPQSQQKIEFNGITFRIDSVRQDTVYSYDEFGNQKSTSGSRIRIIGTNTTRGL